MFFTLFASLILSAYLQPLIANFEISTTLKSTLDRNKASEYIPKLRDYNQLGPLLTSRSAVAIDKDSRKILWSKNLHNRYPIASISKLMTVLVFLDTEPNLLESFVVSKEDTALGGVVYIEQGETVRLRDLVYSALIASDNNAAQALIRASGLTREEFISRMNITALEIGMLNTHFIEPTGLEYANISSVQDVVLLLEEALDNAVIADALSRSVFSFTTLDGTTHHLNNTNKLLDSYLNVVGGKTGFNNEAQYNLVIGVKEESGQTVFVGVLGAASKQARFQDAKSLADWVLRNYVWEGSL